MAAANADYEILQQLGALHRMEYFRMELHTPNLLALKLIGGILHFVGGGNLATVLWQFGNRVAVAHPHLGVVGKPLQQWIVMFKLGQIGAAVFAAAGGLHVAAVGVGHELGAVADAEDGQSAANAGQIDLEGTLVIHTEWRTAQNHADNVFVVVRELVVRHNFAEHVQLAHAAAYQLGGLGSKVQDDDFFHEVYDLCVDDFIDGDGEILMFQLVDMCFNLLQ